MSYNTLIFQVENRIAELTLNRPERINAFNDEMQAELRDVMTRLEKPGAARVLLITGAGRGFCSGQDLSARKATDPSERRDLSQTLSTGYNPLVKRLANLPMPVIAAVNGVAAGAGASFALAADIVIAGRQAKFLQAFVNIGLVPDAGGTYALPRRIGLARAMGLAMLGEPISGADAAEWGLIWQAVDDDKLLDEARALAAKLAEKAPLGLAAVKKVMRASFDNDFATQLDLEAEMQRQCGYTDDYQEGIAAFLEKRKPDFQGR